MKSPPKSMVDDSAAGDATFSSTLVLVEPDSDLASLVKNVLTERLPSVEVTRCTDVPSAREALLDEAVDLVLTRFMLDGGTCLDLLDFLDRADLHVPVVVCFRQGNEHEALDALTHGATDYWMLEGTNVSSLPLKVLDAMKAHQVDLQMRHRLQTQEDLLRRVRSTISTISHEINNPLAIITGNAQLLRLMDVQEDLKQPIQDIEEASQRVGELLNKLRALREQINIRTMGDDTIPEPLPRDT